MTEARQGANPKALASSGSQAKADDVAALGRWATRA